MKSLILKLVIPLTVLFFFVFTKWWYVLPVDAPRTMMYGFPLVWISKGWHTSMSFQIFWKEFLINLLFYFTCILALVYVVNKFIYKIKLHRLLNILLMLICFIIGLSAFAIGTMTENIYYFERDFEVEILDSGYKFVWDDVGPLRENNEQIQKE
ncbi:hypothetical protein [uncultured Tenacibaculum sp.]|uniref:hypothetical protein n=1 Tax=uncultured Tenacibaculum sp. TaxID=174713 RepID=UPI002607C6EC|nr:hypothetical protein [uncultured Tenacibaculum sp.]